MGLEIMYSKGELINDTSPQLGGDLDTNGHSINLIGRKIASDNVVFTNVASYRYPTGITGSLIIKLPQASSNETYIGLELSGYNLIYKKVFTYQIGVFFNGVTGWQNASSYSQAVVSGVSGFDEQVRLMRNAGSDEWYIVIGGDTNSNSAFQYSIDRLNLAGAGADESSWFDPIVISVGTTGSLTAVYTFPVIGVVAGVENPMTSNLDIGSYGSIITITHSVTSGKCVYMNGAVPTQADANSPTMMPAIGISLGSNEILIDGIWTTTGLTAGAEYYVGTDGSPTTTAPSSSGDQVQRIGVALSTTELLLEISIDVLEV